MRFARCGCKDCDSSYMIRFDTEQPPRNLYCIICGSDNVKYVRIDAQEFNINEVS